MLVIYSNYFVLTTTAVQNCVTDRTSNLSKVHVMRNNIVAAMWRISVQRGIEE